MGSHDVAPDGSGQADTPELFDACNGRPGEQLDDLVQVASVGLINAVERYNPDYGAAFSSFAVPTILGEIKRHFRDNG